MIVRITKPNGWTVLNADDPLVREMRLGVQGAAVVLFPGSREPVPGRGSRRGRPGDHGGRRARSWSWAGASTRCGSIAVADVPLTLAGASRVNVSNVLAATAAAIAIGVPLDAVREGLRSFGSDAEHNAGRLNVYLVGGIAIVLDLAHNEASLESLLEVAALAAAAGRPALRGARHGRRPDRRGDPRDGRDGRQRPPTGWSWPAGSSTSAAGPGRDGGDLAGRRGGGRACCRSTRPPTSSPVSCTSWTPRAARRLGDRGVRAGAARGDGRGGPAPRRRRAAARRRSPRGSGPPGADVPAGTADGATAPGSPDDITPAARPRRQPPPRRPPPWSVMHDAVGVLRRAVHRVERPSDRRRCCGSCARLPAGTTHQVALPHVRGLAADERLGRCRRRRSGSGRCARASRARSRPPTGIVMITSWVCSPVHSTRRKSALCSATVAIVKWSCRRVARHG